MFCVKSNNDLKGYHDGRSANEIALSMCMVDEKTLLFTKNDTFTPAFEFIYKNKNTIFIVEDNNIFDIFVKEFENFDKFIIVDKQLNHFESKYFELFMSKHTKVFIISRITVANNNVLQKICNWLKSLLNWTTIDLIIN